MISKLLLLFGIWGVISSVVAAGLFNPKAADVKKDAESSLIAGGMASTIICALIASAMFWGH